jgi:hypothetical protein
VFRDIPIRMIDHQGDFGAQRSGFALNALERSREDSGQAGQGSCPCREQNETTAVHCVWERLSMPDRVSNDLSIHSFCSMACRNPVGIVRWV